MQYLLMVLVDYEKKEFILKRRIFRGYKEICECFNDKTYYNHTLELFHYYYNDVLLSYYFISINETDINYVSWKMAKIPFKLIPLIYDNQSNNGVFVKELNEKIDYKLLYILKTFVRKYYNNINDEETAKIQPIKQSIDEINANFSLDDILNQEPLNNQNEFYNNNEIYDPLNNIINPIDHGIYTELEINNNDIIYNINDPPNNDLN